MTDRRPKVLITPTALAELKSDFLDVLRKGGFEICYPSRAMQMSEDDLCRELPGISATLASMEPYTSRVFKAFPELKVVARVGVGYDAVDVPAATAHGVAITITPGTNQDTVAEHTFALLLGLAKNVRYADQSVREGRWERTATLPVRGQTLGIVGLGRIGKAVAIRGECFGMRLLAYETAPDADFVRQHHVTLVPLERLLAESDYVTLHTPATAATRHLINRESLARMKPTAFLINTARGGLVREADLVEALQNKRLAGAGLDVFENEPPGDHPLLRLDNVLITPHTAGVDLKSRDDMARSAAEAVVSLYQGKWPAHQIVNPEVREQFRWK
jgi:D-3-phosphoglycerate dehydrogenase / 2-oxoglutarate reductase